MRTDCIDTFPHGRLGNNRRSVPALVQFPKSGELLRPFLICILLILSATPMSGKFKVKLRWPKPPGESCQPADASTGRTKPKRKSDDEIGEENGQFRPSVVGGLHPAKKARANGLHEHSGALPNAPTGLNDRLVASREPWRNAQEVRQGLEACAKHAKVDKPTVRPKGEGPKPKKKGGGPLLDRVGDAERVEDDIEPARSYSRGFDDNKKAQYAKAKTAGSSSKDALRERAAAVAHRCSAPLRQPSWTSHLSGKTSKEVGLSGSAGVRDQECGVPRCMEARRDGDSCAGAVKPKEKPPKRADMERIIDKLQQQDRSEIFKEPVTEDVAPGYFQVIDMPMDFTTIRGKLASGEYVSWGLLERDLMVMFNNALTYNASDTLYYKQAKTLMQVAKKLLDLGRQGVTNFRGRTGAVVRAHNAQVAADEKAERNARKAALRAARLQAKNDRIAQKAAESGIRVPFSASGHAVSVGTNQRVQEGRTFARPILKDSDGRRPLTSDENVRWTYHSRVVGVGAAWGGLTGANAEGVPFATGGLVVQPATVLDSLPGDAYLRSLQRFCKNFGPKVRAIIMNRAGMLD